VQPANKVCQEILDNLEHNIGNALCGIDTIFERLNRAIQVSEGKDKMVALGLVAELEKRFHRLEKLKASYAVCDRCSGRFGACNYIG
jgi:hypothetical protein